MKIIEFAEKIKSMVPSRFDVIMAFEEARMYGYRILKFHRAKGVELALVVELKGLDSEEVEVLGIELTIVKDEVEGLNEVWDDVRRELLKHMIVGDSFYSENENIFKMVIRTKSLNVALEKLNSIAETLSKLKVEVSDRFIGYSFKDEEVYG